jgi:hypothetical protein
VLTQKPCCGARHTSTLEGNVTAVLGWTSLLVIAYLFIALFCIEYGSKRVLRAASERGALTDAPRTYWTRLVWVKKHRARLPAETRSLANRVVAFDLSARIAAVLLLVLYGVHAVAL